MIFYFTATGNSQYAAERIAAATGDRLVSIGAALRSGDFGYDVSGEGRIGFVVPTFAWTLPGAVARFIDRLDLTGCSRQYVFGVFTCGASSGHESAALNTLLGAKGIRFEGSFDLVMPDNFIVWSVVPPPARLEAILDAADRRLEAITDSIRRGEPGTVGAGVPESLFMPMEEVSSSKRTGKLHVDDGCTACGLCREICPMGCIHGDDAGRPLWEGACTVCLACLHRCPARAIQFGRETQNKGRYVNPRVKLQPALP